MQNHDNDVFAGRATQGYLRTQEQGADTVIWLAAAERAKQFTGRYFFDRAPR